MKNLLRLTKQISSSPLTAFQEVLADAQKILYDKDKSYLTYQVVVEDEVNEGATIYKAAMSLDKEPVELFLKGGKKEYLSTIFDIYLAVNQKGLFITHVLVNDLENLQKWFGSKATLLFNIKVLEIEEVEKDVILFIASNNKQAEIEDFKLVIKGSVDV